MDMAVLLPDSADMSMEEVIQDFELLEDWDSRYEYLVELGEALPPLDDALRIEDNRVKACLSKVWVSASKKADNQHLIVFSGDCDTSIIKGVLALLIGLMSERSCQEILDMDLDYLFERLRLAEHLSPNRHVGIYAIVDLMKAQVRALCQ